MGELVGYGERQIEGQTLLLRMSYVQGVDTGPLENRFTPLGEVSFEITRMLHHRC